MDRGVDELVHGVQECLLEYRKLVENGTIFKEIEADLSAQSTQNENNKSMTLEDIKPVKTVKPKNVYKRRKNDLDFPKIKDISGIECESLASIDQSFDVNKEMSSEETPFNESFQHLINSVGTLTCKIIDHAIPEGIPTLASLCAFKVGLTQAKNDTELQKTPYHTIIENQYGAYYKLGHVLRDQICEGHLLASYLLPVVIRKCTKSKLPICEMLIEQVIQGYNYEEFWERKDMIENMAQGSSIDIKRIILTNSLDKIEACNDEYLDYVYGLLDQYHKSHYSECLEILINLIQKQVNTLIHPKNFLKDSNTLQKEHYIIMEQLSKFMKFTTIITNKNIKFISIIKNICQPIKPFGNVIALLEAFFNKNNKYSHHCISPHEQIILVKLFKPEYSITSAFNQYTSGINYDSPLVKRDIKLVSEKPRYKRAKISSGDLI